MSLEKKVDGLTAAIVELTAAIRKNGESEVSGSPKEAEDMAPPTTEYPPPETEGPKSKKEAAAAKKKAAAEKKAAKERAPAATAATDSNFEELKVEVGAIANKLGPRVTELTGMMNEKYHATKISELKPVEYADFLADCKKFLEPGA